MGASYYQFCPVSKAMELLDERWTILVVRELLIGSERFNDLRRGLPRMSPTLLSRRLQQLENAGLVDRRVDGKDVRYRLTDAGRELEPVVAAVGAWGARWVAELADQDLDPKFLMWDMHRNVDLEAVPRGRTVMKFSFPEAPRGKRDWWIVVAPKETDVCDFDPGFEVGVTITSSLRTLTAVWRGDSTWSAALRSGSIDVQGPEELRRAVTRWFTDANSAGIPISEPRLVG
jgi:DNA-binding HxlR family transcriptional regulator